MSVGKFVRSLIPGDDRALAARDYAGRKSATQEGREARQRRHRRLVAEESAKNREEANRDIRGR